MPQEGLEYTLVCFAHSEIWALHLARGKAMRCLKYSNTVASMSMVSAVKSKDEKHTIPQVFDRTKGVIKILTHMRFSSFSSFLCFLTWTVARILSVKHLPCAWRRHDSMLIRTYSGAPFGYSQRVKRLHLGKPQAISCHFYRLHLWKINMP